MGTFSYANQNTVDAGIDLGTMFPLLNENNGLLALGLNLQGASRFDFKTKYYGINSTNGAQNIFTLNNRRENFTREVFFNTALSLNYMRSPYFIRLEVTEPVLHSRLFQTRISGGKPYVHRTEPLWLSLQGLRVSCLFTREVQLPFLRYE